LKDGERHQKPNGGGEWCRAKEGELLSHWAEFLESLGVGQIYITYGCPPGKETKNTPRGEGAYNSQGVKRRKVFIWTQKGDENPFGGEEEFRSNEQTGRGVKSARECGEKRKAQNQLVLEKRPGNCGTGTDAAHKCEKKKFVSEGVGWGQERQNFGRGTGG